MYHQRLKTLRERFEEKFEIVGECWLWKSGRSRPEEHPKFWTGAGYERASHVSLSIYQPWKKRSVYVCHKCDNPLCVNPKHLFAGDHLINMRDKAKKGRSYRPVGRKNPKSRLTREIAGLIEAEIRGGGISQDKIAAKYGVGQNTVSQISLGRHWSQKE